MPGSREAFDWSVNEWGANSEVYVDNKFSIGGRHFSLSKLDALKQFHILRRMEPVITPILLNLSSFKDLSTEVSDDKKMDRLIKFATPILGGLSKLSDADAEYVLHGLLASVEVQQAGGNWAKVFANGFMMVNDLDLAVQMQLAVHAFSYNLAGFFPGLPQQ